MEPFPNLTNLEYFPGMESNTMEFKQSLSNIIKNKCISTICSFLNSKGGYIVFGVEDNRRIIGINDNPAELDEHLRWFDNLYHSKRITDCHGNKLKPGSIDTRLVHVKPDVLLMVLTITPEAGVSYKCLDGTAWHRLSASVYSFQEGSAEKELTIMREKINLEKSRAKYALHEVATMRNDVKRIIGLAKNLDEQLSNFAKAVADDILVKKAAAEAELKKHKRSLCSFLFD